MCDQHSAQPWIVGSCDDAPEARRPAVPDRHPDPLMGAVRSLLPYVLAFVIGVLLLGVGPSLVALTLLAIGGGC